MKTNDWAIDLTLKKKTNLIRTESLETFYNRYKILLEANVDHWLKRRKVFCFNSIKLWSVKVVSQSFSFPYEEEKWTRTFFHMTCFIEFFDKKKNTFSFN